MDEPALSEHAAGVPVGLEVGAGPGLPIESDPPEGDPTRSPQTGWPWWSAFLALVGGLVLAAVFGLVVDLPALALGVHVTSSHTPAGLAIADTFVQDIAFVLAAVYCAHLGGRAVRAWQLGLRRPGAGWGSAAAMVLLLFIVFLSLSAAWAEAVNPGKEKLLQQLGSNESGVLLVLSAGLTCVIAPMCEEFLFRGYIFTALRNRLGTWGAAGLTALLFGGVHAGSAPVLDLVPLAALGFGLCLLYRYTGSLYPCIVAHSINNSIAFSALEDWNVLQAAVLLLASLLVLALILQASRRLGWSGSGTLVARSGA